MKKIILLTGGSGNLGQAIIKSGYFQTLLTPTREIMDITNSESIEKFFKNNEFDVIIHCAALARMKDCEETPFEAVKVNINGTSNLVREVIKKEKKIGKKIRFIHISTDGVYGGIKGNYSEKDATIPYNKYGWTKLGAECAVNLLSNFCIIRTSFFDPEKIMFEDSATDAYSSKVTISYLVKAIAEMVNNDFIGTVNIGAERKSDYERYKEFKPSLKKCKFDDILKRVFFPMARDASMDCSLWKSLKHNTNKQKLKDTSTNKLAFGTGKSIVVEECQICGNVKLEPILFLGFLSPVDLMKSIGEKIEAQISYPGQILYCPVCGLVQIGLIIDAKIVFPSDYPYTSSTTKNLRDNFKELYKECKTIVNLGKDDLIIDIGSNDGNLLSNFTEHRVLGITPEDIGKVAIERGIPTVIDFFNKETVDKVKKEYGKAKIITATNVFAHIENVNGIVELILELLEDDGVFISETDYLPRIIEELQYDTMHHEHLMYYSLHSIKYLLEKHRLEVIHAKEIPTHGGSFRVYAARKGKYKVRDSVGKMLVNEKDIDKEKLLEFRKRVITSKLELYSLLFDIKKNGKKIYGIGAPGRATTLVNYVGIDEGIMDCAVEIKGSHKIGKYIPGTIIPVVEESRLFEDQPEYALLLSWHIADELIPKLKEKGFRGRFIVPLPKPRIL